MKTRQERKSKIFFFFSPCLVLMRRGLARMVENVMWKFQKLNFASSFHQYSNPCEEYFGGEELKVGTFLSTVHIRKNSWIDQIWTKFATGSEMVFFFPMHYLQKQSQQFKERTRCWPCMFWPFFSIMYPFEKPFTFMACHVDDFGPLCSMNSFFTWTRSDFFLPVTILYNRTPEIG